MRKTFVAIAAVVLLFASHQAAEAGGPAFEWYAVSRTEAETAEAIHRWSFGPAARRPARRVVGVLRPFRGAAIRRERRVYYASAGYAPAGFGCAGR